jgi:hypothetical protein
MSLVEAVLTYRPHGVGADGSAPVPIGKSSDPGILRTLRDLLLAQANEEAEVWRDVEPGVAAIQIAEPDLRLVEGDPNEHA